MKKVIIFLTILTQVWASPLTFKIFGVEAAALEFNSTPYLTDANTKYYWRLESNSVPTVGTNSGTDTNVSYVAAKFGNGASLSGTGDIAFPTMFTGTEGTIILWFKTSNTGGQTIYQQSTSASDNRLSIAMSNISTAGEVTVVVNNGGSSLISAYTNATTFADNTFHQLVLTGGTGGNTLYIDGSAQAMTYLAGSSATTAWFDTLTGVNRNDIGVAKYNTVTISRFTGIIDDFAYMDRKLSSTEVTNLWNGVFPAAEEYEASIINFGEF